MRILAVLAGMIPLGIGVTVLGFLWLTPFDTFGSPPLFFRIFASFIAFGFVLTGISAVATAWTGAEIMHHVLDQIKHAHRQESSRFQSTSNDVNGYVCQHCGAPLNSQSDVSPHGDVKCSHCGKWFNIHA